MSDPNAPVWFITGCSSGFGRVLAEAVLARGWRVAATARDPGTLAGLLAGREDRALALALDVTDAEAIGAALAETVRRFGRIDVLVNNAGYGYLTTVEEGEDAEIRAMFEANVFGLFAMTRAILPVMRAQRSGHIINITSVAGHVGNPSSGYYAATKHAVEGWSKSLAAEGAPLGIKVTAVAPGPFRTDWAGRSMIQTPNLIEDYAPTAGTRMKNVSGYSGQQAGDPVRAAEAMIALTRMENPPLQIVLGRGGFDVVTASLRTRLAEIEAHRELGIGTDFPA